jgi:hypothetical protein
MKERPQAWELAVLEVTCFLDSEMTFRRPQVLAVVVAIVIINTPANKGRRSEWRFNLTISAGHIFIQETIMASYADLGFSVNKNPRFS